MTPKACLLQHAVAFSAAVIVPFVNAGFSAESRTNIAVYWGMSAKEHVTSTHNQHEAHC